jgi:hypothetical protein
MTYRVVDPSKGRGLAAPRRPRRPLPAGPSPTPPAWSRLRASSDRHSRCSPRTSCERPPAAIRARAAPASVERQQRRPAPTAVMRRSRGRRREFPHRRNWALWRKTNRCRAGCPSEVGDRWNHHAAARRVRLLGRVATAELRECTTGPVRVRLINGVALTPTTTTGTLDARGELHQDQARPLPLDEVVAVKVLDADDLPRRRRRPSSEP